MVDQAIERRVQVDDLGEAALRAFEEITFRELSEAPVLNPAPDVAGLADNSGRSHQAVL